MTETQKVGVENLELSSDALEPKEAAKIYREHGCLIVRGLMKRYVDSIHRDIETSAAESLELLDRAEKIPEGWRTPNGTLFISAPEGYKRDMQIMVLAVDYRTSAVFFHSAFDEKVLDIVEAVLGPDIEIYGEGQCLYKEPVGGHPKHLHQDSAYFEHRYEGPMAMLTYVVDTDLRNGALHVVPDSYKLGQLEHVDTFSHLGLKEEEWPWERALPITGEAGDSIFFNVKTIHGSKENYSDKPRPVIIHRYRRVDDYVVVHGTTAANRAEAEKKSAKAKKSAQLGLMARGFRSRLT